MAVTVETESSPVVRVIVSGKLHKDDYEHFVPKIENLIQQQGKIRVLFEMRDFHGWDASALWEDIKFDAKHFADIERLAIIGEKKWQHGMAQFCRPFTKARIQYFDQADEDKALSWIQE